MKLVISTLLIAMTPVVELRGAIPAGVAGGLPLLTAAIVAIIGNLIPVPFVLVFIRSVIHWMEQKSEFLGNIASKLKAKADSKKDQVLKSENPYDSRSPFLSTKRHFFPHTFTMFISLKIYFGYTIVSVCVLSFFLFF